MAHWKSVLLLSIIFLVFALLLFLINNGKGMRINKVCFGDRCFEVEVAKTAGQRAKGLMGRSDLPENQGMLFVFPEQGDYGFWMKNMLIPIDIIWTDKDLAITHIEHGVPPCEAEPCAIYKSQSPSQYVLEIKAGLAQELRMETGDKLYFPDNDGR